MITDFANFCLCVYVIGHDLLKPWCHSCADLDPLLCAVTAS